MILWRISEHAELDGIGGLLESARWHTQGRPVVYCALNPATSLVEVLVHTEIASGDLPDSLQYLEIEVPDGVSMEQVDVDALAGKWQTNLAATQRAGDEWLGSGRTALFRVPSVIVPATWNVLINPRHPERSQIRIVRVHRYSIDPRLIVR